MTCSESTDNAVSVSNQEAVTALVTSTGTESLSDQRAAHRPGVSSRSPGCGASPSDEFLPRELSSRHTTGALMS